MINTHSKTPVSINYDILERIEQMVSVAPKGTALGLCDLFSAMCSGYFIESGGAVMPAVEAYLKQEIEEEEERARRSRRAAKALTYGSYNVNELIEMQQQIVAREGQWQATRVQGYRVKAVDFTAFWRAGVKKLKSKAYKSEAGRAVAAVPIGLIASVGEVNGQRVALVAEAMLSSLTEADSQNDKEALYKRVAKSLAPDEVAAFDAGFSLGAAMGMNISQCVLRLAKNCTFGEAPGEIPERSGEKGRIPTQYKAKTVRPLAREHGGKELPATAADEILTVKDEQGIEIKIHVWPKLYFLERQLKLVSDEQKKKELRQTPIRVVAIYHPSYDDPLLLGCPLPELEPENIYKVYTNRWPVEGIPQTGKYLLSGGGGRHFVHQPVAMERLPLLSLIFGSLLKYVAATLPPFRTGFWDRLAKPTYGRLIGQLKKVGVPLSRQLFKKDSVTAHLPVGYEAIRLARA